MFTKMCTQAFEVANFGRPLHPECVLIKDGKRGNGRGEKEELSDRANPSHQNSSVFLQFVLLMQKFSSCCCSF